MTTMGIALGLVCLAVIGQVLHHHTIRTAVALLALAPATLLFGTGQAGAADVGKVHLGTATEYSVLGGQTVTNTGGSTLGGSVGLAPGTSVTGFPPGQVPAPAVINIANGAAQQAQADLTAAYIDAAGRSLDGTTTADLGNLELQPGVYAGPSKGALGLTGTLTLNGGGNTDSVFIFQTDSSLTTGSGSSISLTNGAQECNIYWVVGSSATLGSGSVFAGNILALSSITVTTGVTVHGRALARNGAVTLDNDVFTRPSCAQSTPGGSSTTTPGGGSVTTTPGGGGGTTTPNGVGGDREIPGTGGPMAVQALLASAFLALGVTVVLVARRRNTLSTDQA